MEPERLYEHNFDPEAPDSKNGMKLAISKLQEKSTCRRQVNQPKAC